MKKKIRNQGSDFLKQEESQVSVKRAALRLNSNMDNATESLASALLKFSVPPNVLYK